MFESVPKPIVKGIAWLSERWPWFGGLVNRFAIDSLVNVTRNRPHPLSTLSPYTSWDSLTNRRWSARHLPPRNAVLAPPAEAVAQLFARGEQGQKLCAKSTCLFPAFAQYLTDGFIRTDVRDPATQRRQNTSNHDIDLCPLYGLGPLQTRALRLLSNDRTRRGRLKSEVIGGEEYALRYFEDDGVTVRAGFEALDPPLGFDTNKPTLEQRRSLFGFGGDRANATPQVAMINTLLLREHNRLAGLLETALMSAVNAGGAHRPPACLAATVR